LFVNENGTVRYMSPREAARLQSFPDDFIWPIPGDEQRRIGNSVPPNLMRAIAEHIRREILEKVPA
jgi:DNA (cytosine-5)-methyltransferase 1